MSEHSNENSSAEVNVESITDQSQSSTTTASIASSSPASSLQSLSIAAQSIDDHYSTNQKFKISFDNPERTYYSGDTIRGTLTLTNKQKKKIRGIYFRIIGYGKVRWSDLLRRDSVATDGKGERSAITYCTGNEEYINTTMYIVGSKNGPSFTLPEGITSYDFSFNLKTELPSSFAGGSGKIKYKMEFVVDKPWKFDEKQTIVLNIVQTVNLNHSLSTLRPFEHQLTRTIGYIGSGPISLHIYLQKCGYVSGERIPIQAIVTNHSKVHVEKLKFALNKIVDYHSKSPGLAVKREIHRLLKKEAGGVSKKTEQRYEHMIDVPTTIPTQDSKTSRLIHIKYELKVEAKLSGLYKNLMISVPITVGNIPHSISDRPQAVFPQLPDLPPGLSVRLPSAYPIDFDVRRLSMSSNSSFRVVSHSSQSDSNASSLRSSMYDQSTSSMLSVPNSSYASAHNANLSTSTQNLSTGSEFQPSAPPMDLNSTPIRPASVYMDAPPSYDDVFGTPSTSFNQTNFSNSSLYNPSIAKT
ncbi:arrestin domain-containing protein 17-like [Contarinia nasturtii]|uniref:arrestin domain-containing protein 17-like n=1 Tax=Contarinia nasturtii TaxID=265458 RepID=UPI0012D4A420|nr:arrestin domain-containing protein 17-like [Contarinia nasturtii]